MARGLLALGTLTLVAVAVAGVDTSRPGLGAGGSVDIALDERGAPAGERLPDDEVEALRALADPDRLRCEPRGCERWRLPQPRAIARQPVPTTVLELDDLVLVPYAPRPDGDAELGSDASEPRGGSVAIAAYEPVTGTARWQRRIPGDHASRIAELFAGPHGALVVTGGSVVSLDHDGEVVWRWSLSELHPAAAQVHATTTIGELTLLHGLDPGGPGHEFLAALDRDTGQLRWVEHHDLAPLLSEEAVIVRDRAGVARLDPGTGDVLWEEPVTGRPELHGRFLLLRDEQRMRLLDVDTGETLLDLDRMLSSSMLRTDDLLLGILRDPPPDPREMHSVQTLPVLQTLVAIADDGTIAWERELGSRRDWWWSCCSLADEGTTVVVASPGGRHHYDLATGEPRTDEDDHAPQPGPGGGREDDGRGPTVLAMPPTPATPGWRPGHLDRWRPATGGADVHWEDGGLRLEVRGDGRTATIRSGSPIHLLSRDPLVVADGRHLLAVTPVADDPTRGPRPPDP